MAVCPVETEVNCIIAMAKYSLGLRKTSCIHVMRIKDLLNQAPNLFKYLSPVTMPLSLRRRTLLAYDICGKGDVGSGTKQDERLKV